MCWSCELTEEPEHWKLLMLKALHTGVPTLVTTITKYVVYQTVPYVISACTSWSWCEHKHKHTESHTHAHAHTHTCCGVPNTRGRFGKVKVINNVDSVHAYY